jgi:exonuclease SbcD
MNILHTADWHLGHRLIDEERFDEFNLFLEWMIETIINRAVEVLVISGDLFDSAVPSAQTEKLYHDFLNKIIDTDCKHIVIVGGNHDSPQKLMVSSGLLKRFDIHVVGSLARDWSEMLIPVKKSANTHEEVVICAMPFLRNGDILQAVSGESFEDMEKRYAQGLANHYRQITDLAKERGYLGRLPIIATGHLFVMGQQPSDSERTIHVGKLGSIPANAFPEELDYLALGHLHRRQQVGGMPHIRYSGSPLAFSFSERDQAKSIELLTVTDGKIVLQEPIPVPVWRKLVRIQGPKDEVMAQLESYQRNSKLPDWLEIIIETPSRDPALNHEIRQMLKGDERAKIINVSLASSTTTRTHTYIQNQNLEELKEMDVFNLLLQDQSKSEAESAQLRATFQELLDQVRQNA